MDPLTQMVGYYLFLTAHKVKNGLGTLEHDGVF
jgi:hypothetical protein